MTNNDILRRIRYIFDFNDTKMIKLFSLADDTVTREQVCNWLKTETQADYVSCNDKQLATFLNGLIVDKRGQKPGPVVKPESRINNNIVLKKLKIALNLQADDILNILEHSEMQLSKHELSAFFRKPGHKNYRECKDQVLRNFLQGLELSYRNTNVWTTQS